MTSERPHYRIDVSPQSPDTTDQTLIRACHHAGFHAIATVRVHRLYFIQGDLTADEVDLLAEQLLADTVTETFAVSNDPHAPADSPRRGHEHDHAIEATLLPGVTDPAAENLVQAAHALGITTLEQAATGQCYLLRGTLTEDELQRLAVDVLSNPVIQRAAINQAITPPFVPYQQADTTVEQIALRDADNATLQTISKERRLALDLNEMLAIQAYFQHEERDPTDAELETLAQTWSEHCVHKTFKARITFISNDSETNSPTGEPQIIDGLLKTYIRGATEQIAKPWVRSAFVDNAGIIAFDDIWDLAFKVETHNHPSALEPFGGANTGVGGVVRDVLGVSARPIANTDVLCFGPSDISEDAMPDGVLHPRRVADGVIHGVEDYGNKMGIPTVNGAVLYHEGYTANPLVFCGCLGLLPHNSHPTTPQAGDLIVVIGGRTGRDGLRGATFSSMEMDQTTSDIAGSAVQIGHPIHEKQVQEVVLRARDEKLYNAITDCGAGGLASAVGEMGQHIGAHVRLETVPLKYPGLRPWEIWLSEAQERMVLAVPPQHWPRVQELSNGQNIEAVCIGEFGFTEQDEARLRLVYNDIPVGNLAMTFLHDGIPRRELQATWTPPRTPRVQSESGSADLPCPPVKDSLLTLLAHPDIRSKEDVVRRYDHEVQGGTIVKPLVGIANHGPSDAAVLAPLDTLPASDIDGSIDDEYDEHEEYVEGARDYFSFDDSGRNDFFETDDMGVGIGMDPDPIRRGIALSVGVCPAYGERDPYAMAWAAIDEAMRNCVAVGADPDSVALLDNFCWGNPTLPDRLGSLVRCVQGCYDAALAYNAPFISGKDSLNNEYTGADGRKHAIPGTLLISALGIVPEIRATCTMDLKHGENLLYIIGTTYDELGGSHYVSCVQHQNEPSTNASLTVPQPVPDAIQRLRAVYKAMSGGLVQACHDCSEGGIGVALAEMCLAGGRGAKIDLHKLPGAATIDRDDTLLFSESLCRLIVEIDPDDEEEFEELCADIPCACIGKVTESNDPNKPEALQIMGIKRKKIANIPVSELEHAWRGSNVEPGHSTLLELDPEQDPFGFFEYLLAEEEYNVPAIATEKKRVLILHANGTNRDGDAAVACEIVGGEPEIVHINQLLNGERHMLDYHMLVVPGGFSYGDDLGAGTLWAFDIRHRLGKDMETFIASGRPVLGICNGFQTLVKAGLLPGEYATDEHTPAANGRRVTLAPNESGHFECRWVYLRSNPQSPCLFTQGLDDTLIYCPVAHGEGRLVTHDSEALANLQAHNLIALTYVQSDGEIAGYPFNPNGSYASIAGLCNRAGNIFGMMPHPEDHIFPWQHPHWHQNVRGMSGLLLFEKGIKAC